MMLYITGIGVVTESKIYAKHKGQSWSFDGIKKLGRCLKENNIVLDSIKDFGRLDDFSKRTVASTALALYDTPNIQAGSNSNIGIIGTSDSGSLNSNFLYFKDYIDSGRKMGRGNLFVYTLPTASISAASIAFGFRGPVFFEVYSEAALQNLFRTAEKIMHDFNCTGLVLVFGYGPDVTGFYIEELNEKKVSCDSFIKLDNLDLNLVKN